jgi:hypothetical protein
MSTGYIYILSNISLPGLLKIGKTDVSPEKRAKQLGSTGVPSPFIVEFSKLVSDPTKAENEIHTILGKSGLRHSNQREFFHVDLSEAIQIVEYIGDKYIPQTENQNSSNISKLDLYRLFDAIEIPQNSNEISSYDADQISDRLADIARMGLPIAMMHAAYIYIRNCKSALRYRQYWQEYLDLYKKEADAIPTYKKEGQRIKREIGMEVAQYLLILSENDWLVEKDFNFVQNFLNAGDQFIYEGFIRVVEDSGFPSKLREQCLSL